MILPLINAMTLKTNTSTKIPADTEKRDVQRSRRPNAKTGLMLVGMLMVAATMLRMARRRPR